MVEKKNPSSEDRSLLSSLLKAAAEAVGTISLFFNELKRTLQSQADWLLRRAEYVFVVYLWISTGVLFLILGVFYLMIDWGHFPRGMVFSVGGLLILLISIILLQAAKIRRKRGASWRL
jgi:hypothetical protein